ncbi:MAG: PaREP1 family protein [Thermoproteus sp.]
MELSKPWLDLEGYKKTRMLEAEYEAELAERFLRQGLVRNAAGKAFQAWKALMGAMLADKVAELERLYPGSVEIREGRRVKKAYWILALVPTTLMKELSQLLGREAVLATSLALQIHQYNGPDREGVLSPYRNEESAKRDIQTLIDFVKEILSRYK